MKLFIDVDNTILEHSHFYSKSTESRTHKAISNNIKLNKEAIKFMYDSAIVVYPEAIKSLWLEDDVYILTKYPNLEFDEYKQEKLAEVLEISRTDLLSATDSKGNKKYINVPMEESKIEFVKRIFNVENVSGYVLVDDYSENIREWEDKGGIGMKFYNEYNSPLHPNIGVTIANFKVFEMYFNKQKSKKIFLKYEKSFGLEQEVNDLFNSSNNKRIVDVDYEVFRESLKRLNINSDFENKDYDYLDFIKKYYELIDAVYPRYWHDYWHEFLKDSSDILFKSAYSVKVKQLCEEYLKYEDYLLVRIVSNKKAPKSNYDMFISIEQNKHYIEGQKQFDKVKQILGSILD